MQINNPPPSVIVPSRFPWMFSIILTGGILLGTIGLASYNMYLSYEMQSLEQEESILDNQIQSASMDRKIIITKILNSNTLRPSIDVSSLVREFQKAAVTANVRLKGFSITGNVISTTLIATEGDSQVHPDPAATIIKMMREYARGQKYFDLEPISTIAGDNKERTTTIQFKVTEAK